MGRYTHGTAKYDYTVTINLDKLMDNILDKLKADDCEWEADCNEIIIRASDTARFKSYHCDATLYDPPEDDFEMVGSIEDVNVEQLVLDAFHELQSIKTDVEIDYEGMDCEVDEPNEDDRAYDEWRDRQLEDY